jgi:hypothetical protein
MALEPNHDKHQRGEALRTRVMVANALCSITESQLHSGEAERAATTIEAIRGTVKEIKEIADDSDQLSSSAARELSEFIMELEKRIGRMETALRTKS